MTPRSMGRAAPCLIAGVVLAVPQLRAWLESDMARQMLLAFPLFCAAGATAASWLRPGTRRRLATWNHLGLTGLALASLTIGFWMIPAALDQSLLQPWAAAVKYASLIAAGFALRLSLAVAPVPVQAFFVGNAVWMMATAGLLYQEAPMQLCLSYLQASQQRAGEGLVIMAVALGLAWCVRAVRTLGAAPTAPAGAADASGRGSRATPG